jgi:hypothetical protein
VSVTAGELSMADNHGHPATGCCMQSMTPRCSFPSLYDSRDCDPVLHTKSVPLLPALYPSRAQACDWVLYTRTVFLYPQPKHVLIALRVPLFSFGEFVKMEPNQMTGCCIQRVCSDSLPCVSKSPSL